MGTLYRLGEIAEIGRGSSPRPISDSRYFDNGNIPWIKIADATASEKNIYKTREYVNDFGASFSRKLKPGALIIAASGTLGFPKFLGVEGCIHDGWMYFSDFKENIINRDYLYYCLITLTRYFNNLSYGAAIQNINTPILKNTKVLLPKLSIQQRIASILSAYDDLIENNNKRIKILEKMAENLYKEWFVRFRFPGHSRGETKQVKPKGWVLSSNSAYIECPKSWGFNEFIKIGKFVRGKNITADNMITGEIPVISAGIEPSGYHNACNVNGQSITISASGANAGYLKYHQISIWAADCSYCQDSNKLWFLYHSLKFLQPVISNMQTGAAQPHVYPKHINKLYTIIPDEEILLKFQEVVSPIYDSIKLLREKNTNLTKQRDMLLPHLMSGKLEV